MRNLTIKEIEGYATHQGVKKIAVENFLMSMGSDNRIAILNLRRDAIMYEWNVRTVKAIENGIVAASGS